MNRAEKRRQKKLLEKAARNNKPGQPTAAIQQSLDQAMGHHTAGRLPEAEAIYQQILQSDPGQPTALHLLGVIAHQVGKNQIAVDLISKALVLEPDNAAAHNNLGNAFNELGKLDEAVASYQKALALNPDYAQAHYNLGNVLKSLGRLEEAVARYHQALAIKPDDAVALNSLGNALKYLGKLEQAVASYGQALAIKPDDAHLHYNLGVTLNALNRSDEAVASYHQALVLKPGYAEAHYNLGNALHYQGDVDGATDQFDLAMAQQPQMAGWGIRKALLLPVIAFSQEDILARRQHLHDSFLALQKQNLKLEDPEAVGATSFHLAYHNVSNKSIVEDIAKLYVAACPKLAFQAEHCRSAKTGQKDRLRIGFLSSFLRNHTIGKLLRGIIENLSRDRFGVIVFRPPGGKDEISEIIDRVADKVVPLHNKLESDRQIIAGERLDILFYYDIGMDPYTYFLSFARLAPVQAVCIGHPDTTGIANIDYFISSDLIEPAGAAGQYSEQLVQLSLLPSYYYRPDLPEETFSRADFGLPEEAFLYVCPQALFKLHPDFDDVIGDLLRRDPDGFVVLIDDGKGGHWKSLLLERLGRSCPDVVDRVMFVAKMAPHKFLSFLGLADALLDVPTFSGGNTSLEAFAMTAPIVTWPGNFMRSRVTAGCYKQMGLSDLIAADGDEYVSLALKLAHDAGFRSRMQADIKSNCHKLYERQEVVREMEAFFIEAVHCAQKGELLACVKQ